MRSFAQCPARSMERNQNSAISQFEHHLVFWCAVLRSTACLLFLRKKNGRKSKFSKWTGLPKPCPKLGNWTHFGWRGGQPSSHSQSQRKKNKFKRHRLKKNVLSSHPLLDVAAVRGPSGSAFSCHCHWTKWDFNIRQFFIEENMQSFDAVPVSAGSSITCKRSTKPWYYDFLFCNPAFTAFALASPALAGGLWSGMAFFSIRCSGWGSLGFCFGGSGFAASAGAGRGPFARGGPFAPVFSGGGCSGSFGPAGGLAWCDLGGIVGSGGRSERGGRCAGSVGPAGGGGAAVRAGGAAASRCPGPGIIKPTIGACPPGRIIGGAWGVPGAIGPGPIIGGGAGGGGPTRVGGVAHGPIMGGLDGPADPGGICWSSGGGAMLCICCCCVCCCCCICCCCICCSCCCCCMACCAAMTCCAIPAACAVRSCCPLSWSHCSTSGVCGCRPSSSSNITSSNGGHWSCLNSQLTALAVTALSARLSM